MLYHADGRQLTVTNADAEAAAKRTVRGSAGGEAARPSRPTEPRTTADSPRARAAPPMTEAEHRRN